MKPKSGLSRSSARSSSHNVVSAGHAPPDEMIAPMRLTRRAQQIDPEWRRTMIRQAAYYRAERRGFAPGREVDDWLQAERDIDAEIAAGHTPVPSQLWDYG